ncbi:MAG: transglycosylase domain-containing protein [Acidimicrobiaceae bacterium]|nr:transglycosylase domain-containing protein [Acidimicrobiaceae bacterium]
MRLVWKVLHYAFSSVWLALVTVIGVPLVLAATVFAGLVFLPLPATLPIAKANPPVEPTVIYDQFGHVIATLAQYDSNVPVTASEIPQVLKEAVVADEDRNFYKHGGVALSSILRALIADIKSSKTVQGGSTITQQYVKLAYTNGSRTVQRKLREAILAGQLDREASKNDILYHYLAAVYFGDGATGVGAAAENYFHVPVSELDASQAAALAGVIPAPSARALREHIGVAEQFRELVLGKMRAQHYLTPAQYRTAMAEKLALATDTHPPAGATLVYPPATTPTQYPDFVDYVTRWLLAHYPASEVYGGGLKVQTTLNPAIQADAEAAVQSTLSGTGEPLEMALAAVQPQTGFVQAVVGGRAFGQPGAPYANDNFAISACDFSTAGLDPTSQAQELAQARAVQKSSSVPATCWNGNDIDNAGTPGRQPGSSWKPFVLATAFEQGIQPTATYFGPAVYQIPGCQVPPGQPSDFCQIHNDETDETGTFDLATAMAASVNTVYAQVAPQVGCENIAHTAKVMGIESAYWSPSEFPHCERYALGESDVSPLDMASAYGVFDDHGLRAAPTPVLEIVNSAGKILVDNISTPPATSQVIPANVANNVTNVLESVLGVGGTAAGRGPAARPAAGKTGTTSNETNAWFTGYTATLSASVWLGYADSQSRPLGNIKGVYPVVGGTLPAATWQAFMNAALRGVPVTGFDAPAPITPPKPVISSTTTTTVPVPQPGPSQQATPTPAGGANVESSPTVFAPAPITLPPATSPSVTVPATSASTPKSPTAPTTTLPASETTSTTVPQTSSTTLPGGGTSTSLPGSTASTTSTTSTSVPASG